MVVVGTARVELLGVPFGVADDASSRSVAREGRGPALGPGMGVLTFVETLRINFP